MKKRQFLVVSDMYALEARIETDIGNLLRAAGEHTDYRFVVYEIEDKTFDIDGSPTGELALTEIYNSTNQAGD